MKKLLFIVVFAVAAMAATAQKGVVVELDVDTINGNETIYLETPIFTGSDVFTLQAACDNVGGTSEGTLSLEGSVDGTDWVPLAEQDGIIHGYATTGENDSLTITDDANISWVVQKNLFVQYRVKATGAAGDSTLVTVKYVRK
ncbi:MAG: hypothetical protein ACOC2F_00335 [Bacteroidota bacterium]